MENKILRRMNLSSFLMVPVQRITKYPLLLARLLKVDMMNLSEIISPPYFSPKIHPTPCLTPKHTFP